MAEGPETRKAAYDGSALQALFEASGHRICERCHCCDTVPESAPCWQCGGFEPEYDDEWDDGWCSACEGEREIYFDSCLGNCDENGNHKTIAEARHGG